MTTIIAEREAGTSTKPANAREQAFEQASQGVKESSCYPDHATFNRVGRTCRAHENVHEGVIGRSAALRTVLRQLEIVAPTNATVLIQGETGTGKELIARAVHRLSGRRAGVLASVNCAAIPAGLLESELFGHERGAFTGAISRKLGRFELAHEGTLFLDEVGDLPLELQPKLLRVLQEHEFARVGSTQVQRVSVRLVTATSRDLSQMVAERQFRSDLYYRINVFPLRLPPLRERGEDISLLVQHFAGKYARALGKPVPTVAPECMNRLLEHTWPGNIRELQNLIERAVILSTGTTLTIPRADLDDVSTPITASASPFATTAQPATLEQCERGHILHALNQTRWVVGGPRGAAALLAVKRTTLIGKMDKLGISRKANLQPSQTV